MMAVAFPSLWDQAVAALPDVDQRHLTQSGAGNIIEQILALALQKQAECLRKRWKYTNRRGDVIIIRDVFAKVAIWVDKFKTIGDVVVQYDPSHAGLPWAAVRLILQLTVSDSQTFGAMAEGVELVSNLIARYALVEALYLQKESTIQDQLLHSMLKLYEKVLIYLCEAYKYYSQGTLIRFAKSIEGKSVESYLDDISIAQSQVEANTRLISAEVSMSTNHNVEMIIEGIGSLDSSLRGRMLSLEVILADFDKPIMRTATLLENIHDALKENERENLFTWLSSVNYRKHHRGKAKLLMPGTCKWLFNKPEYIEWQKSSSSSILWLHGIPGSGKSMLISSLIERLHQESRKNPEAAPIAYFYCARTTAEPERADPTQILRSILEQLSSSSADIPIRNPVVKLYKQARSDAKGRNPEPPEPEEIIEVLLKLLDENPATIIIDALDECEPGLRQNFLLMLTQLIRNSSNILKVFVSSRDDQDIAHRLKDTPNVYISATDNNPDIREYVNAEVAQAIAEQRILNGNVSKNLEAEIIRKLTSQANGMFRLVSLHIQTLCNPFLVKTAANVNNTLAKLPLELNETYDLIFHQIEESLEPNPSVAARALKWILCSRIPLNFTDLTAAISVDASGRTDCPNLSKSDILSICCNLVVYDSEYFQFAHLSVREYLEKKPGYTLPSAHLLVLERSLYSFFNLCIPPPKKFYSSGPYPECWYSHYSKKEGPLGELLRNRLWRFFYDSKSVPSFGNWLAKSRDLVYIIEKVSEIRDLLKFDLSVVPGKEDAVSHSQDLESQALLNFFILDNDFAQDRIAGPQSQGPLPISAQKNNLAVFMLLLKTGSDVRARDAKRMSSLGYALRNNNREMVLELLRRGIEGGERDGDGKTHLQHATILGHLWAVEAMLESGNTINARDDKASTALMTACESSKEDIARLLLKSGADVHALSYIHEQAIHLATFHGHTELVCLLIDFGANVNSKDYRERTPLHIACYHGFESLTDILLNKGADFTMKAGNQDLPVEIAAAHGHVALVALLLGKEDSKATVDVQNKAVLAAIRGGQPQVIRELINAGANVSAMKKDSALLEIAQETKTEGQVAALQIILDTRPSIDSRDDMGRTLLHQACRLGFEKFVSLLLNNRAGLEVRNTKGETPLLVASGTGDSAIIRLLLGAGADINAETPISGYTALHVAAEAGHLDVVKILVDAGANVNAELPGGESPAILAADKHEEVFNFLLGLM